MRLPIFILFLVAIVRGFAGHSVSAGEIYMSYPGLTGDSSSVWIAKETETFKDYGIDARLIYMEGGRLSTQSLLSGSTQFMTGEAVAAFAAVAGGADIVLLASAKNVLPYVFAVSNDIKRSEDLKGRVIATSQIGGRAGEIARMAVKSMGLDPDKEVKYLAVGGTMSRLAALSTGRVQAAPISQVMIPVAEERGLRVLEIKPIPFIIDGQWTTRKYAEENSQIVNNFLRAYVKGVATLVKERERSVEVMRRYMRVSDSRVVHSAYDNYKKEVDRVPIPSEKAIQNTLEITYRIAPRLENVDIKKHLYFGPIQRLKDEGFIDRLYK
jgi:ABC-type nitrate/sulfonate/bicarbonate transport system substrate-binding protein